MIDFVETHVEFILEFLHMLFPLIGEQYLVDGLVEQLSGIPVT
jgi:hypothetical protein